MEQFDKAMGAGSGSRAAHLRQGDSAATPSGQEIGVEAPPPYQQLDLHSLSVVGQVSSHAQLLAVDTAAIPRNARARTHRTVRRAHPASPVSVDGIRSLLTEPPLLPDPRDPRQVDRKFVAVTVQQASSGDRVLALVDQHAADERVRVEVLQRNRQK